MLSTGPLWIAVAFTFQALFVGIALASESAGGFFSNAVCFELKDANPNKVSSLHDLASASRIGWIMSGAAAAVASIISFFLIYKHAQYYTKPNQQRYIIRICLMVPIYAIVSWLSYFYYRQSVYYEVLRDCYEAFVIASFFILLLQYLGDSTEDQVAAVKAHWELKKFPFPFNCIAYSPASTHFLWGIKYGILQYTILKPITTLVSMIAQLFNIYCPESYSPFHVHLYVVLVGFMSVTVAMYALITFYMVVSDDLKQYKPFSKFLCVKLIIFFCFWQYVAISLLASFGFIHETEYWTEANIANGLNSIVVCFEMIAFAILHLKAFDYRPYRPENRKRTHAWRGLVDSLNPIDSIREILFGIRYFWYNIRGKPMPRNEYDDVRGTMDIAASMELARPGSMILSRPNSTIQMLEHSRSGRFHRLMSVDHGGRQSTSNRQKTKIIEDSGDTTAVTIENSLIEPPPTSMKRRQRLVKDDHETDIILLDDYIPQEMRANTFVDDKDTVKMTRNSSSASAILPPSINNIASGSVRRKEDIKHQHHDSNTGSVRSRNKYGSNGHSRKSIDQGKSNTRRPQLPEHLTETDNNSSRQPPLRTNSSNDPYRRDDVNDDSYPVESTSTHRHRYHTRSPSLPENNNNRISRNTEMSPPPPTQQQQQQHRRQRSEDKRSSRPSYDMDSSNYPDYDYRFSPPSHRRSDDRRHPYDHRHEEDEYQQRYYRQHHRQSSNDRGYYKRGYYTASSPSSPTMASRRYPPMASYNDHDEDRAAYDYYQYMESRRAYDEYMRRLERYNEELSRYEAAQRRHSRSLTYMNLPEPPAPLSPPLAPPIDPYTSNHRQYRDEYTGSSVYPPPRRLQSDWRREPLLDEDEPSGSHSRSPATQRMAYEEPRTPPGIVRRMTNQWERTTSPDPDNRRHRRQKSDKALEANTDHGNTMNTDNRDTRHNEVIQQQQQQQQQQQPSPAIVSSQQRASFTDDTSSYYAQSLDMSNSHSNLPSVSLSQDPSLDDRWRKNTVISHSPDLSSITDSDPSRTPTFSVSLNQHNISSIALQPPPAVSSHTLSVPPMGRSHGSLSRQSSLSQQSTNGQHGTGSVYYAESLNGPEDIHEDEDDDDEDHPIDVHTDHLNDSLSNSLSGSITGAQYALSTDMEMENYSIDIHLTETGPSSAATTHSMAQRELMHNQPSYHLNEEDEEDLSSEQYHDRYYSPSHEDRFAYRPFISNNEDHSSSEENISRYIPGDRPGHTPPAINMGYDLNTSANTSLTIHTPVVRQGTTPSTLTLTSMGQSRGITSRSRINHHHHHGQPTSPTAPTVLVATPAVSQFLHPQTGRYTMMDPSDTNDDDEGVDGHRTLRKGRSF